MWSIKAVWRLAHTHTDTQTHRHMSPRGSESIKVFCPANNGTLHNYCLLRDVHTWQKPQADRIKANFLPAPSKMGWSEFEPFWPMRAAQLTTQSLLSRLIDWLWIILAIWCWINESSDVRNSCKHWPKLAQTPTTPFCWAPVKNWL